MGGRSARAARLWGALEALEETAGIMVTATPLVRSWYDYENRLANARSRIDEARWEAAWAEGRAMTLEQAAEHALSEEEPPPSPAAASSYPAGLSAREAEVLRLVARGMTNAQIAQELYLSPRTVNTHLTSVYGKLGVGSRAEAVRFAVEHCLV